MRRPAHRPASVRARPRSRSVCDAIAEPHVWLADVVLPSATENLSIARSCSRWPSRSPRASSYGLVGFAMMAFAGLLLEAKLFVEMDALIVPAAAAAAYAPAGIYRRTEGAPIR